MYCHLPTAGQQCRKAGSSKQGYTFPLHGNEPYEAIVTAQRTRDDIYAANPISFCSIPIDPAILEEERQFQLCQRGGLQVIMLVGDSDGDSDGGADIEDKDQRSVASIDSIAENANFVSFE